MLHGLVSTPGLGHLKSILNGIFLISHFNSHFRVNFVVVNDLTQDFVA